jgi:type IV pilus assembly protein PilX
MRPRARSINDAAVRGQSGATLLVAIMMLLVITLLAISSMRGVSLESRITGNVKQQKSLNNAAEAGLRIGEENIVCATCKAVLLVRNVATTGSIDTATRFGTDDGPVVNNVVTSYEAKIQWYVVDITSAMGVGVQGDCALRASGKGSACPHYYEINSCASTVLCTSDTVTPRVIMRTVVGVSQ